MSEFLDALRERVLIFDGAMGTQIHAANLSLDDFRGKEGNSEVLNFSRPDVVESIHAAYLQAGADAIETNTFGGNIVAQAEYEMADQVYDLNLAAARIARSAASSFTDRRRFVVGSMGPGTKAPSLGQATFVDIEQSYALQARGLMDGGVDVLLIETCFDILQTKAAIAGVMQTFDELHRRVPLMVQVTIETTGTMLLGTEIGAALTTIDAYPVVDVVGINCATGPVEMTEHVRYLCSASRRPVSVLPNAGLPELRDGQTFFPLTPQQLLDHHKIFVQEFGVAIIGGCCGTTPEYIELLVSELRDHPVKPRDPRHEPGAASLYSPQPFTQDVSFFVVGERCNTQGSRKFKELVGADDFDSCLQVAQEQVREGAHALDVCVDFTGRDGPADAREIVSRFRGQVTLPLFVDSTEPEVVEAALELIGGRAVINSVNLEEGIEPGSRFAKNLRNARRFGAGVVAGAIEEQGQANTADWKVDVCKRLHDVLTDGGLRPEDILFDPLALPISTGLEEARRYGVETLDAIARIKDEIPGTYTILGVSNVSFGLNPAGRQVLNSVYLHEAVERGLDAGIVHAGKILPLSRIGEEERQVALDLIYDRRRDGYDPLQRMLQLFEGAKVSGGVSQEDLSALPMDERLKRRIIDAERNGLEQDLDEALQSWSALEIINTYLLDGMRVVGELFASGEMQLPFVLQSAETMKRSVGHLEPHMEKVGDGSKGKIVLATVKGDVHDIGKNLVDIILTNNGYTVFNIGIKQPVQQIIETAEREKCDAIGMSGLLVKSTLIMRENLEELNRRQLHGFPVLLGGAALTRPYVEGELRDLYEGDVYYCKDAFDGLHTMDALMAQKRGEGSGPVVRSRPARASSRATVGASSGGAGVSLEEAPVRSEVAVDVPVPVAPFYGTRVVKGLSLGDIAKYVNRTALFRSQWQYRRKKGQSIEDFQAFLDGEVEATFRSWLSRATEEQILQPAVVYGFFPCASDGNDLIVYAPPSGSPAGSSSNGAATDELTRFTFPRQPGGRRLCISDFFRPVTSGERDVVGFHLVTMGSKVSDLAAELFAADKYTDYLHLHGFGVEMAEALAEMWHKRMREELGIAGEDAPDVESLFKQRYRGSRYSFGYPACPNLEDHVQLFELLDPGRIGVELSDEYQLVPEQSTDAIVVHHPAAKYFTMVPA